jgi:hypothetical protein
LKIFPSAFSSRAIKKRKSVSRSGITLSLNAFLAQGRPVWRKVREVLQRLPAADTPTLRDDAKLRERAFYPQRDVTMQLPARIGDYTDFYLSFHHAHNVGTMLRGPENALMPNWKWLPVGPGNSLGHPVPIERALDHNLWVCFDK